MSVCLAQIHGKKNDLLPNYSVVKRKQNHFQLTTSKKTPVA